MMRGVCRLILAWGEAVLCDICRSTPDFITNSPGGRRRAWDSVVKRRQGCCSTGEKPLELIYETEGELEDEEPELIALRRQLLDILSDTAIPMKERISRCCALMDMEPLSFDMSYWRDFYLGLERLDETWTAALENLGPADVEPPGDMAHTRLLQYLIYRHFASAGNRREAALMLQFCILSLGLISALERSGAELTELVRLYSSEIEYSDENIARITEAIALYFSSSNIYNITVRLFEGRRLCQI